MKNALAVEDNEMVVTARGFKVEDLSVAQLAAANGSGRRRRRKARN